MAEVNDAIEYTVEKIIDLKWFKENGVEVVKYRVRWSGFSPLSDTWEPPQNFNDSCQVWLRKFIERYKQKRAERLEDLTASGQVVTEEELRKVNILSNEIEEVRQKRGRSPTALYLVKWVGESKPTWVAEDELIHAQDKVDTYLHSERIKQVNRNMKRPSVDSQLDSQRRKQEQEFYKKIEKGDASIFQTDLYTRVKGRRDSSKCTFPSPSKNKKHKYKRILEYASSSSGSEREDCKKIKEGCSSSLTSPPARSMINCVKYEDTHDNWDLAYGEASNYDSDEPNVGILDELPLYDPLKSKQEFERLESQVLHLSKEEFEAAVDRDDYQTILASLRSKSIPQVDFNRLFIKTARRGGRDIALLLAPCVTDLSTSDDYGNSAICLAAERGDICLAYHLLRMHVPWDSCNGSNETLLQIASKAGRRHFIKFLRNFENS